MIGLSVPNPEQPWEPFQGVNHISNLARSGVTAVSHLAAHGWMEAEPKSLVSAAHASPADTCDLTARRPHIILLLDEFELRYLAGAGHQGAGGLCRFLQVGRWQDADLRGRGRGRADLVHGIQRADGPLGALVRQDAVLRHAHRRRPHQPRPAAVAEALRLSAHSRSIRATATSSRRANSSTRPVSAASSMPRT